MLRNRIDEASRATACGTVGARTAGLLLALSLALSACTGMVPPVAPAPSPVPSIGSMPTSESPSSATPTPVATTTTPSSTTSASPASPVVEPTQAVVFGDPWSSDQHRVHAVIESAIDIIDRTTKGQTILLTVFNLTYAPATQALMRAHDRGVNVEVVVNERAARKSQVRKLRAVLGTRTSARSWLVVREGGVRMHSKFLLTSGDGQAPVVWVSSGNLTSADGRDQANAALVTTGDRALYDFFATQFELLSRSVTDARKLGRTAVTTTATAYTFPLPRGGAANDPVEALLDNVTCRHDGKRTTVRLAQLMFKTERVYLADRLRELEASGCVVRFVGHLSGFTHRAVRALVRSGPGRIGLRAAVGTAMHAKVTSVDGWDASGHRIKAALVGTHNLSGRSLTDTPGKGVNDELALLITNPDVVDAYNAWIDGILRDHSEAVR